MKLITLSKLALVAGIALSAAAYGAESAAAPAAAAPAAATKAAPAAAPKAAKAKSFSGMVVSTDAIANTIVVKGAKAEETFSLAATAKISQGKKEVKLGDIAKDEKVTVKYMEDAGVKTASDIKVSAASKKKEAKPAATAAAPQ